MKQIKNVTLLLLLVLATSGLRAAATIDLSGEWQVNLQTPAAAEPGWRPIRLPGTLTDAGIGEPLKVRPELTLATLARLQTTFSYVGPAWYRRSIDVPPEWAGRRIILEIERVLWTSQVWVDGRYMGRADSLSAPHVHDLSVALAPGRHELLVLIDNREIFPGISHRATSYPAAADAFLAHAYTNHTQTLWNGMLGALRLRVEPVVTLKDLAVFPRRQPTAGLRIEGHLSSASADGAGAAFKFVLRKPNGDVLEERTETFGAAGDTAVAFDWPLANGADVEAWDEFTPALYRLEVHPTKGEPVSQDIRFGFREVKAEFGELRLNGRRLFLRGTLECAVYPLTGYPPTDRESWRRILLQAQEWGLNHLRFHSWCPPEAAFVAADELGIYFQVELPHWSLEAGTNPHTWEFLQTEARRILAAYGNHPSFLLLSLGNELQGDMKALDALVRQLQRRDDRRLYMATTFTFEKGYGRVPGTDDQYFVTQYTEDGWIRGQGIFNEVAPAFDVDYRAASKGVKLPLISHEIGQYAVFPDLREIARYTGNLVPANFMAVRDDLGRKGLLELAPRFTEASGKFAALLYKEEIERALRTPQFDGFQLLGLQDFPGQGTALVGLLNVFWESKGVMQAERFREFCGPVVPLARFPKAIYERGEVFRAEVEVVNFQQALNGISQQWVVRAEDGTIVASGKGASVTLTSGAITPAGQIVVPIPESGPAQRWELEVSLNGVAARNRWNLWVYPRARDGEGADVEVVTSLDEALRALNAGRRVLFNPPVKSIQGIPGRFVPVFWSPVHFPDQPGTMGILCDPKHAALRQFPTAGHSDWQWWDPALRSRSVVVDGLGVTPIVRVIDNFNRNHSLANVFEAKVGEGRLLFSAVDVSNELTTRPVARQLRRSLLAYLRSEEFKPAAKLTEEQLRGLVKEGQ